MDAQSLCIRNVGAHGQKAMHFGVAIEPILEFEINNTSLLTAPQHFEPDAAQIH
jgi:hypothetical protein